MTNSLVTRRIAAHAVRTVLEDAMPLEQALMSDPDYQGLEGRDRSFARLIVATTFRRLGQIDAALTPFVKRLPPEFVHAVLRTACAQILFLGTPPHAAVGETVSLLKSRKSTQGFANMANAVLRRVVEKGPGLVAATPPKANIPHWISKSWERNYGAPALRKMAARLMKDPVLDITVKSDVDQWAEKLGGEGIGPSSVRLPKIGDVKALEGYNDGEWWAQDIAATLPVALLGDVAGLNILDLCAAPGGKTMQLAARGAHVTAVDRSEARLERLKENLKRTKLSADVICADILEFETEKSFDVVLVDAPCTATGTFRRHPDVLVNKSLQSLGSLMKLQRQILKRSTRWVAPGGRLLYCTCSLQPEEGGVQIDQFLQAVPDFRLNPLLTAPGLNLPEEAFKGGMLRTLPHFLDEKGGMDGFFIALMQRNI